MKKLLITLAVLGVCGGCEKEEGVHYTLTQQVEQKQGATDLPPPPTEDTWNYCCTFWQNETRINCWALNDYPCDECYELCGKYPLPKDGAVDCAGVQTYR